MGRLLVSEKGRILRQPPDQIFLPILSVPTLVLPLVRPDHDNPRANNRRCLNELARLGFLQKSGTTGVGTEYVLKGS